MEGRAPDQADASRVARWRVSRAIDVLAFPPDSAELAALKRADLQRPGRLERRGRCALFVSVGLFLTWVVDVAAVFQHPVGWLPAAFGFGGLALACLVVVFHAIGRTLIDRARRVRRSTEHAYSPLPLHEAGPVVARAAVDPVVAQYLRMVGRQRRALLRTEADALLAHRPIDRPAPRPGWLDDPAGAAS